MRQNNLKTLNASVKCMKIKRRVFIRIISFSAAVAAVLGGTVLSLDIKAERLEAERQRLYGMYLSELDGSLYNINVALKKTLYTSSPLQLSRLAAELCSESTVAKNALSQLPVSSAELENVYRLLSQAGDYTLYLSKKAISGETPSEEERESIRSLCKAADSVSQSVGELRTIYDRDGTLTDRVFVSTDESLKVDIGTELEELEELLTDYPSLLYDGPFSDHLLNGEIKMLKGKPTVDRETAKLSAASILGIDPDSLGDEEDTEGKMPCYNFFDGEMSVSVTKQGGYVVYMRKYRSIGAATLDCEEAAEKAAEYLKRAKGTDFKATYYFADEGVVTVNFAHKEGATVCYPDLVKVGVALDTGEIVLLEAGGYIANHCERTVSTPKYTSKDAEKVLSEGLTVNGVQRVIIPTDGKGEVHCYEFDCNGSDGDELLVYINVADLGEEKILLLLKTDGGTLTK